MQARMTSTRQEFTDIRNKWSNAKLKKSVVLWIAIGAIVLTLFLGFTRGGWTTTGPPGEWLGAALNAALLEKRSVKMRKWEKWPKVSVGPRFDGKPGLAIELPKGPGQVYRENQYVTDVSYRFSVREVVGELTRIWGYVEVIGGIAGQFRYGEELTLHLDDGRPIEIVIKTFNFNSGEYLFADKSVEEEDPMLPKWDIDKDTGWGNTAFYARCAGIEFKKDWCPDHCPLTYGANYNKEHAPYVKTTKISEDARRRLKVGTDTLLQAVMSTLDPKGCNVALDKKWGRLPLIMMASPWLNKSNHPIRLRTWAPVCVQVEFFATEPAHSALFIDKTRPLTYREKHEGATDGAPYFKSAQRAGTTSSKSQHIAFSTDTSYRSGHPARSHTPQKPAARC